MLKSFSSVQGHHDVNSQVSRWFRFSLSFLRVNQCRAVFVVRLPAQQEQQLLVPTGQTVMPQLLGSLKHSGAYWHMQGRSE